MIDPVLLILPEVAVFEGIKVSDSPTLTGIVGTPAKTPTDSSTLDVLLLVIFEILFTWVTDVVPILILPPIFTS